MNKRETRSAMLTLRAALEPGQVMAASRAVCHHLASWPLFQAAETILAYMAFGNEVSLQELITGHLEKRWVLPRTLPAGRLLLHQYQPKHLVKHPWGMLEPAPNAPAIPPNEIALALVPGVAYDQSGGRLGFGGGYYDRLLGQISSPRVGVTYLETCIVAVPRDSHDLLVDWLARPDGIWKCDRRNTDHP